MAGLSDRENKRKKAGTIASMVSEHPIEAPKAESKASKGNKEDYERVTIYMRPEQRIALKMRAALGKKGEKDVSEIVRNAVDAYLDKM